MAKHSHHSLGIPTALSFGDIELKKRFLMITQHINFKGKKCLDVGCGNGFYTVLMAREAKLAVGIDLQRSFLGSAKNLERQNESINFLCMSADDAGFPSDFFDIAICLEVLEHTRDEERLLCEIKRTLKVKGFLALSVPSKFFPFEQHPITLGKVRLEFPSPFIPLLPRILRQQIETARVYSTKSLCKLFNECGFTVKAIDYVVLPEALTKKRLLKLILERLAAVGVKIKPLVGTNILIVAQKLN